MQPADAAPMMPSEGDAGLDLAARLFQSIRIRILPGAFAIAFGMAMTLCIQGYQFGQSNHTVYLFDALRRVSPELLQNDWYAMRTLQYHAIFGWIAGGLVRLHVLEAGFLVGYLALIFLHHLAWYRLVLNLGGTRATYLLSVLLYHISAGGTALGMYSFFQDSSFLPSNVANVAMLWGIYFWIVRKYGWAGLWLGVAGLFHLNHALVGIGLWIAMSLWALWRDRTLPCDRAYVLGAAAVLGMSSANILLALGVAAENTGKMPLADFVELYVKLRHGHHYDPSSWPLALWICFLWSAPLAVWAAWHVLRDREGEAPAEPPASCVSDAVARREPRPPKSHARAAAQQASRMYLFFWGLLLVALVGAGIFYISEPLIQMSLYRFSIYIKLFNSIGAAYLIYNAGLLKRSHARVIIIGIPTIMVTAMMVLFFTDGFGFDSIRWLAGFVWRHRGPIGLAVILSITLAVYELIYGIPRSWGQNLLHGGGIAALLAITTIAWGRWLGVDTISDDDEDYLRLCAWVRENTPVDAIFLVPPQEQAFRLHAQRAIVINYKGVPQLSGQLPEWRDRLQRVLAMPNLLDLPRPFESTLPAIAERYTALPTEHLMEVAGQYNAAYIVAMRPLEERDDLRPVFGDENGRYFLYDLTR